MKNNENRTNINYFRYVMSSFDSLKVVKNPKKLSIVR